MVTVYNSKIFVIKHEFSKNSQKSSFPNLTCHQRTRLSSCYIHSRPRRWKV